MNDATLEGFRMIAAAMQTEPTDWQWIGPHMSQRHFGITRMRAEDFARRFGGEAAPLDRFPAIDAELAAKVARIRAESVA